jgi:hypothetical protein
MTNSIFFVCKQAATGLHHRRLALPTGLIPTGLVFGAFLALCLSTSLRAAPMTHISVDGDFSDWDDVPTYTDPYGNTIHNGVPDVHDTDHGTLDGVPGFIDHPDVDILKYKFTHDENNLYAYFKVGEDGKIGNTQTADQGRAGRYYVIVTIDVDNDNSTGYLLHEGGYYPTSGVDTYDMNMEAEFYDGQLNTAHYLSHDAKDVDGTDGLQTDFYDLTDGAYTPTLQIDEPGPPIVYEIKDSEIIANSGPYTPGFVEPEEGNYDNYTQWVYHDDDTLTHVQDRGSIIEGIMRVALSPDGHEIEIAAPFKGFLNDSQGNPNMALGKTLDISFSLESSGEFNRRSEWASDTADPIVGYVLEGVPEPSSLALAGLVLLSLVSLQRKHHDS